MIYQTKVWRRVKRHVVIALNVSRIILGKPNLKSFVELVTNSTQSDENSILFVVLFCQSALPLVPKTLCDRSKTE